MSPSILTTHLRKKKGDITWEGPWVSLLVPPTHSPLPTSEATPFLNFALTTPVLFFIVSLPLYASPNNILFHFTWFELYINGIMLFVYFCKLLLYRIWNSQDSSMLLHKSWNPFIVSAFCSVSELVSIRLVHILAWWTAGLFALSVLLQAGQLSEFVDRPLDAQHRFL